MSQDSAQLNTHDHLHEDGTVHDGHGSHVRPESHAHGGGHIHTHVHAHGGEHPHVHSNKKAVVSRLKRANGHLESVIRMVEDDRDCPEVLMQLAAVRAALNNAGKVILQDHITECITDAVFHDDQKKIDELNKAIAQFIK